RAQHADSGLNAVAYPGAGPGRFRFRVRGLVPDGVYACDGTEQPRIRADRDGEAVIKAAMIGRTESRIRPAAQRMSRKNGNRFFDKGHAPKRKGGDRWAVAYWRPR